MTYCAIEDCFSPAEADSPFCAGHRAEGERQLAAIEAAEEKSQRALLAVAEYVHEMVAHTPHALDGRKNLIVAEAEWRHLEALDEERRRVYDETLALIERSGRE